MISSDYLQVLPNIVAHLQQHYEGRGYPHPCLLAGIPFSRLPRAGSKR